LFVISEGIEKLKEKAVRRKGRGFGVGESLNPKLIISVNTYFKMMCFSGHLLAMRCLCCWMENI